MFLHPSRARLSDFADHELDVETRKRTARHLETCSKCRNTVLSIRRLLAEANHYPSHHSAPSPELRAREPLKRTILRDVPAGIVHDLTALMEQHEEVTVGRKEGNVIQLGGDSQESQRKTENTMIHRTSGISTVSRQHATIRHEWKEMGEGIYLKDHSTNGVYIGKENYKGERIFLDDGDELYFGLYGPVEYRDIPESVAIVVGVHGVIKGETNCISS